MICNTGNIKGTGLGKCMPYPNQDLLESSIIEKWKREAEYLSRTDLNHRIKSVGERIKNQSMRQLY